MAGQIATRSEKAFTPPQWLVSHHPGHEVQATRETAQNALAAARRSLEVAGPELLAIMLAEALTIFALPSNWSDQSNVYVAALEDLPADLAREGLQHVVMHYKYKFPKPGDIREPVEEALASRRADVQRLETILKAGKFIEPPLPPKTEAEKAEAAEIARKVKEILQSND